MSQYRGLVNQGSTCYLNSLLQTLFMTPQFRQNVYNYVHDERKISTANSIPYQLQKLFVLLQLNQSAVYTKGLLKSFQWTEVDSFQQHDVQQFCRILFEALEKASKGTNWIEKLYSGVMESVISCGLHPRGNQQIFLDISLPIKNQYTQENYKSIQECLRQYLRPESIDDKVECEKCGEKVKVQKAMRLVNLPPILTLTVNRFQLNYETMQRQKINSFLYFPEILELWRYLLPFQEIKMKDMPKELFQKILLVQKQKSARTTDWGIGGLSIEGKKVERKKSFEVEAQKKQTKFYDEQNRDKRQDETKKLSAEEQKIKNLQILKDLKADRQKIDKKCSKQAKQQKQIKTQSKGQKGEGDKKVQKKQAKEEEKGQGQGKVSSSLEDDFLFGSFMEGIDISGKTPLNEYEDIQISNETNKGPKKLRFQKTEAIFQHEEQSFDPTKEYPKNTYVLFSILVHSGGAYGGHYYAYIFNGQNWYCFNDNNVTKVSKQQIRKYGHPSQQSSSGANAYLLFYRQASTFKNLSKQITKIPQGLLQKVKLDKNQVIESSKNPAESESTRDRYNQIQNGVVIKMKYKQHIQTLVIPDRYIQTVSTLRQLAKDVLNVEEKDQNWRIRRHNRTQDSMHQIYDIEANLGKRLDQIGLRQTCYMIIETKKDGQLFSEYDPKNICIKLNVWRQNLTLLTQTYLKPTKIWIRQEKTFEQFYKKVEGTLKLNNPVVIKRNFSVGNPYQIFDLETSKDKTLISLRFFNGINLYVEQASESKPKWEKQFESERYKCQIKFNNPQQGAEKNYEIFFDTRKTLGELKQRISEIIGLSLEDFRIKKNQQSVSEMTNYKKRLTDLKFVNTQHLHIEQGKSSKGTLLIRKGVATIIDDQIEFVLGEEFQMEINDINNTVAELKQKIGTKQGISQFNIRIREYRGQQFSEIIKDSENLLKIREKSLVWEQLQIQDPKGIQIYLRVFNVMTLQLGPLLSVFIQASGNYEELALILQEETQIQSDRILAHNPMSKTIHKDGLFECNWIQIRWIQKPIRDEPLFLKNDGQILIIKEANQAYHPKPIKKNPYSDNEGIIGSSKDYKKQTGLKITVVEQKQTEPEEKQVVGVEKEEKKKAQGDCEEGKDCTEKND